MGKGDAPPPSAADAVQVEIAGITDVGQVRDHNEDAFLVASLGDKAASSDSLVATMAVNAALSDTAATSDAYTPTMAAAAMSLTAENMERPPLRGVAGALPRTRRMAIGRRPIGVRETAERTTDLVSTVGSGPAKWLTSLASCCSKALLRSIIRVPVVVVW